jgi:hypothetical protein
VAGDWECEVARIGACLDELPQAAIELLLVVIESLLGEQGMPRSRARGEARILLGLAPGQPGPAGGRHATPQLVRLAAAAIG